MNMQLMSVLNNLLKSIPKKFKCKSLYELLIKYNSTIDAINTIKNDNNKTYGSIIFNFNEVEKHLNHLLSLLAYHIRMFQRIQSCINTLPKIFDELEKRDIDIDTDNLLFNCEINDNNSLVIYTFLSAHMASIIKEYFNPKLCIDIDEIRYTILMNKNKLSIMC